MNNRFSFSVLLFFFVFSFCMSKARKPNVIFILADDLGYNELGSYGQKKIRTPHLDKLAKDGMRFSRNYSGNAVCAPSRCVLMTGKHPGHAFIRNNGEIKPEGQRPIPLNELTMAEVFKKEGYTTGAFGKWGLGSPGTEGDPMNQGFDRFFGYNCQRHAHSYYPDYLWSNRERVPLKNNPPVPGHASLAKGTDPQDPKSYEIFKGKDYSSDRINEQALKFIKKNKDKPFFLYYPTLIPHVALHVPDEELKPYLTLKWNDPPFTRSQGYGYTPHFTPRAAYAAMITRMDRYVGNMVNLIERLGLTEDTIVIFTSDNGTSHLKLEVDYDFFNSVGNLRGLKGSLYEGGIRVPLIAKWPGKIEAGSVSDQRTGFEDWMITLHDLIDAKTPLDLEHDGFNITPDLLGQKNSQRPMLYREFSGYGGQQAVWMGKWKGIRQKMIRKGKNHDPLKIELFDLSKDESESDDLATKHPDVVNQIRDIMEKEHIPSQYFPIKVID
jgi:arylsulfatase A-like enzyme